ncbi:FAD-dependent thymidylate synthase [Comamonas antarctica]|uniref:FAD-dependent thymidylate synthase n=1 Tax=Comamonas antarctica TaxID=2743470 RepID=UPI0028ED5ACD|nr:FAD-dependent thymidylate synthase [Comamonas antarctica]
MNYTSCTAEYVGHMLSDLAVVNAARQSFAKQKDVFDEKDAGLIQFLATGMRTAEWDAFLNEIMAIEDKVVLKRRLLAYKRQAQHWAPFGHPHVTLRLRMPIFLARQFVKHQVGGVWSEESRRYINEAPDAFVEPVLLGRPADVKQGAAGPLCAERDLTARLMIRNITRAAHDVYLKLVGPAIGLAPEQAREVLPVNTMTGVTWTGSLLFWSRVVNQRVDSHAQGAAQALGRQIAAIVQPLYPVSWEALVGDGGQQ